MPQLPPARIVCVWPGASAAQVEELVTRPLEERTSALDSMQDTSSETRDGVVVITLGQRPARPAKIEQEWDKLRASLAHAGLPDGCLPPRLQTEFGDVVTLLLAVTSPAFSDYRSLSAAARSLVGELEQVPEVAQVQTIVQVGETIDLVVAPAALKDRGLSLRQLAGQLGGLGQPMPGTLLRGEEKNLPVRLGGGPATEAQLRAMIVGTTPAGVPRRLDEVFAVRRGDQDPLPFTVDVLSRGADGPLLRQRSVLLAVEMRSGQVIGRFDRQVRAAVQRLTPQLPAGVEVVTISDQPGSVSRRLDRFGRCFGEAVVVTPGRPAADGVAGGGDRGLCHPP